MQVFVVSVLCDAILLVGVGKRLADSSEDGHFLLQRLQSLLEEWCFLAQQLQLFFLEEVIASLSRLHRSFCVTVELPLQLLLFTQRCGFQACAFANCARLGFPTAKAPSRYGRVPIAEAIQLFAT